MALLGIIIKRMKKLLYTDRHGLDGSIHRNPFNSFYRAEPVLKGNSWLKIYHSSSHAYALELLIPAYARVSSRESDVSITHIGRNY